MSLASTFTSALGFAPALPLDPANLPDLRHATVSPEQNTLGHALTAEYAVLHSWADKFYKPSSRAAATLWALGAPDFDAITDKQVRAWAEGAAFVHDQTCIREIDSRFFAPKDEAIKRKIAELLKTLHDQFRPVLLDEIERVSAGLVELTEPYGLAQFVEQSMPMQLLRAEQSRHACPVQQTMHEPSTLEPWLT